MIAIDTNVLVRVLTNDDPVQTRRALALMRSGPVRIAKTVLLETEWVLRFTYGIGRRAIGAAIGRVVATSGIEVEDRDAVLRALSWHAAGMDFADALHVGSSEGATSFATFDRQLARSARRAAASPRIVEP